MDEAIEAAEKTIPKDLVQRITSRGDIEKFLFQNVKTNAKLPVLVMIGWFCLQHIR